MDAQGGEEVADEAFLDSGPSYSMYGYESYQSGTGHYGTERQGHTGIDVGGLAHSEDRNAWVNNWTGWNATTEIFGLGSGSCTASAWIEGSPNLTDGYFTVVGQGGVILAETRIAAGGGYQFYSLNFRGPTVPYAPVDNRNIESKNVGIRAGLWGNGALSWLRMDDILVVCDGF